MVTTKDTPRASNRWLAPLILAVGLAIGTVGVWWMVRVRPAPGPYVDVLAVSRNSAVAIRGERGNDRAFAELIDGGRVRWQAHVPHYQDPPHGIGIAASVKAVAIRVVRQGRPEVFALSPLDAAKLGGIALTTHARKPSPIGYTLPHVTTVSDGKTAYELCGTEGDWTKAFAFSLDDGRLLWREDVPPHAYLDATFAGDDLMLWYGGGVVALAGATGEQVAVPGDRVPDGSPAMDDTRTLPDVVIGGRRLRITGVDAARVTVVRADDRTLLYAPAERVLASVDGAGRITAEVRWPSAARQVQAHHAADGALWMVLPDRVAALDAATLQALTSVGGPAPALEKSTQLQLVAAH
jgi:hypothetical protein